MTNAESKRKWYEKHHDNALNYQKDYYNKHKEEIKQKAEDYALSQWEGQIPWSIIQKAYYDGYRDCEKEIITYAKIIIKDLLDNSDEYARQRAMEFIKENE